MLLNKASLSDEDPFPELVDIITNSKLPLFEIQGDKQIHLCSAEELKPLVDLMEKTDTQIRKKLETLLKIIKIRNEHANANKSSSSIEKAS